MDEAKIKALDGVMAQIEKQYGKGAIMRLGQDAGDTNIEVLPTGCLSLDLAIGVGGLPRGRIIEIYGPESSGKTTVALHVIAETQWIKPAITIPAHKYSTKGCPERYPASNPR